MMDELNPIHEFPCQSSRQRLTFSDNEGVGVLADLSCL